MVVLLTLIVVLSTLHCAAATIFPRFGAPLPTAAVVCVEGVATAALVVEAGVAPSVAAAAAPRGEARLALGGVAAPHKVRF